MTGIFYIQSSYSMLKSTISIPHLVSRAKKLGHDFVALSDESNMHGFIELYQECKKNNIKPVYGLKIDVSFELFETEFLVYAKDELGFKNLLKLSSKIMIEDNVLSYNDFLNYCQGLLIISSKGKQFHTLGKEAREQIIKQLKSDHEDFYLGIQNMEELEIIDLATKYQIAVLPISQTLYLDEKFKKTIPVINAILGVDYIEGDYHLISKEEIKQRFSSEVLFKLKNVINKIKFEYEKPIIHLPKFPISAHDVSSANYLIALSKTGLNKRLRGLPKANEAEYQQRLVYELEIITKMKFSDYFLIVFDIVRYAKQNNVLVGPGRGSAAGSLVSYVLGITEIDPIKYKLLFERFLNPEREGLPDIDLDFPDDKRNFVIDYVKNKYGSNHIVSISTFNTLATRSSIRDVSRVLGLSPSRATAIINAYEKNIVDETDEELVDVLRIASTIEGLPRQTGTHAAGIILSDEDLTRILPLQKGAYDFFQSQLEAKDLEWMGLLKIDFLGIKNLATIHNVINQLSANGVQIDLQTLKLDDKSTYDLLSEGDTSGIFQLESSGMRRVLVKLIPDTFADLYNILALYRPGPLENIDEFIARRNGKKHELVEPHIDRILSETYGIILYQEQIMEIANQFAGYTYAEADLLRRGISKKDVVILKNEEKNFIAKCLQKGHSKDLAKNIYDYIVKFADYGFNKSHSVAYALVAYQMAYLKANYYQYFMLELLNNVMGSSTQTQSYINEMKNKNIFIQKPHINISLNQYRVYQEKTYYPLTGITGIGKSTYTKIHEEREQGKFLSYDDFKLRTNTFLSDANLKLLIYSGALDCFGKREDLVANMSFSTAGYIGHLDDHVGAKTQELSLSTYIEQEKLALGFNLFYNPLDIFYDYRIKNKIKTILEYIASPFGDIIGYISKITTIKTKKGEDMSFVRITDGVNEIEAIVFPNTFTHIKLKLTNDIQVFNLQKDNYKDDSYIVKDIKQITKGSK